MPHAPTQELEAVLSQQQILVHAIDWHIQVIYMLIVNMSIRINTLTQLLRGLCPAASPSASLVYGALSY